MLLLRVLSHLTHLVRSYRLSSLIQTKITGVKPPVPKRWDLCDIKQNNFLMQFSLLLTAFNACLEPLFTRNVNYWIRSFLTDHPQRVFMNMAELDELVLNTGALESCVLSTFLFSTYRLFTAVMSSCSNLQMTWLCWSSPGRQGPA